MKEISGESAVPDVPRMIEGADAFGLIRGGGLRVTFEQFEVVRAVDIDGFGGSVVWKAGAADSRGDTDAFDVRKLEHRVVLVLVVGESGAVSVDRFAGGVLCRHGTGGNVGGDEGDLTDGPAAIREDRVVGIIEGLAHDVCSG